MNSASVAFTYASYFIFLKARSNSNWSHFCLTSASDHFYPLLKSSADKRGQIGRPQGQLREGAKHAGLPGASVPVADRQHRRTRTQARTSLVTLSPETPSLKGTQSSGRCPDRKRAPVRNGCYGEEPPHCGKEVATLAQTGVGTKEGNKTKRNKTNQHGPRRGQSRKLEKQTMMPPGHGLLCSHEKGLCLCL